MGRGSSILAINTGLEYSIATQKKEEAKEAEEEKESKRNSKAEETEGETLSLKFIPAFIHVLKLMLACVPNPRPCKWSEPNPVPLLVLAKADESNKLSI